MAQDARLILYHEVSSVERAKGNLVNRAPLRVATQIHRPHNAIARTDASRAAWRHAALAHQVLDSNALSTSCLVGEAKDMHALHSKTEGRMSRTRR